METLPVSQSKSRNCLKVWKWNLKYTINCLPEAPFAYGQPPKPATELSTTPTPSFNSAQKIS